MELAISIASAVFALFSVVISWKIYKCTVIHDRKKDTLDAYNTLQEQVLDYINLYKPSQIKEIVKNDKSEEYKKLSGYVARIEHFCVGVNQKIYDCKVIYELAHGYFDGGLKSRIDPIIEHKNRNGNDYYMNIHRVYAKMESLTKTNKHKEQKR